MGSRVRARCLWARRLVGSPWSCCVWPHGAAFCGPSKTLGALPSSNSHSCRGFFARPEVRVACVDMCACGAHYQKPTSIVGTLPNLETLQAVCQGGHVHEHLQGTVRTSHGSSWKTTLARKYPPALCRQWAALAAAAAPPEAKLRDGAPHAAWWGSYLAPFGGGQFVLPKIELPRFGCIEWAADAPQWGGGSRYAPPPPPLADLGSQRAGRLHRRSDRGRRAAVRSLRAAKQPVVQKSSYLKSRSVLPETQRRYQSCARALIAYARLHGLPLKPGKTVGRSPREVRQ